MSLDCHFISLQIAEQVEDDLEAWNQAQRLAYHSSEAAEVPVQALRFHQKYI